MHVFLNSALTGGEWRVSHPDRVTSKEISSCVHWKLGWVWPRIGLDDVEKKQILDPTGTRTPNTLRSAQGQSLYRLHYPGHHYSNMLVPNGL
jgi:hypothetical protein